jgi:hypothetical protein
LVPYLREQVIKPVAQINQQVSINGGTSESPTILDKLHEIQMEVRETKMEVMSLDKKVHDARTEVAVLGRMYDGHIEWSQDKVDQMSREIRQARKLAEGKG